MEADNTKDVSIPPPPIDDIKMLEEILDDFESGYFTVNNHARKCYLSEEQKAKGHITWIHDNELQGQCMLRKMGKQQSRDVIRNFKQQ